MPAHDPRAEPTDPARLRKALGLMATASFFFFCMSVSVKAASGLPILQVVFFRAAIALALCLAQLRWEGVPLLGTHRRLLVARGVFGTAALCCYFASISTLPLATATVLQNLSPLFTAALAFVVLGQRLRPVQIGLFALAGLGIALVHGAGHGGTPRDIAIALAGAALSACAYACISAIGTREHPLVVVVWFPMVTVPVIAPVLPWIWVWPTPGEWLAQLAVGCFVQIAQVFMTRAYQLGPAGPVSLVSYLGVVWAGIGGWLLFDELPTPLALLGMTLVVAAVVGTSRAT